ncbi:MAG: DUF2786 domain-containing protein [Acidimicrobiales bacterium]
MAKHKQRKHKQQRRAAGRSRPGPQQPPRPANIRILILSAAIAGGGGQDATELLVDLAQTFGRRSVGLELCTLFSEVLGDVFEGGWQPAEVARVASRRHGPRHAEIVAAAMAADPAHGVSCPLSPPETWASQLRSLGCSRWWGPAGDWLEPWASRAGLAWAEALGVGVQALGAVMALPVIEKLVATPSQWASTGPLGPSRSADDPVLAKVRALLAKAESTSFEAEAEALTAKAQELIARHAIDDAVTAGGDQARAECPVARRTVIDDPYAEAKSSLLLAVASANGVRCVWYQHFAMMAVVGFAADLDAVDALYTSLLVQATRSMLAKGKITDPRGHSRTRSFRQSFLVAFASRIRERLSAAASSARYKAEEELSISLLPVLASRAEEVDGAVDALFPRLRKRTGPSVTNQAGWVAGRTAAELAVLGPEHGVLAGSAGGHHR